MKKIIINDKMRQQFVYYLTEPVGENFCSDFNPQLTPQKMLSLGVFGGKYMTDCEREFPTSWFENAKLSHTKYDSSLNYFGVKASQPLSVWQQKGWIYPV